MQSFFFVLVCRIVLFSARNMNLFILLLIGRQQQSISNWLTGEHYSTSLLLFPEIFVENLRYLLRYFVNFWALLGEYLFFIFFTRMLSTRSFWKFESLVKWQFGQELNFWLVRMSATKIFCFWGLSWKNQKLNSPWGLLVYTCSTA